MLALPWLGGARAPWWRDGAGAAFLGLGPAHGPADLARAAVEAVAWEIDRCLDVLAPGRAVDGRAIEGLALAGGSTLPLWMDVLTGVTGLAATRRRSGDAASAGAALLTARALGAELEIDELDPEIGEATPAPESVQQYGRLRPAAEAAARAVIGLADQPGVTVTGP